VVARPAVRPPAAKRAARRLTLFTALVMAALWLGAGAASAMDVTVLDAPYNAAGDGVTNDRPAIQQAIDDVSAAGGGIVALTGPHTYLTGDLELKDGVTLFLAADAVLKQSTSPADYLHTPSFGRAKLSGIPFDTWADTNVPLVFAHNASNVAVTGFGRIEMSSTPLDSTTIMEHAIGFSNVSHFTIADVTIAGAMAYNVTIRNSDHGEINHVTTTDPAATNSDGISLMNSSFMFIHDNHLTTLDDGIVVWASYKDPRASSWWDSDTPRPSHDIEVVFNDVNVLAPAGARGFALLGWTQDAPDASQVEISRLNVHDNRFVAPVPLAALTGDPFHGGPRKTPTKDLRFVRNLWFSSNGGELTSDLKEVATTDFTSDDPSLYNFSVIGDELVNGDFDGQNAFSTEVGTSFWSTEGGAVSGSDDVGQPGGRYGEIHDFPGGYAGIYQGIVLTPGTYTFSASVQSSDVNARLFAIRASGSLDVMASTRFNTPTWERKSLTFTVTETDTYRFGIDNLASGGGPDSFARIDSATLARAGSPDPDPDPDPDPNPDPDPDPDPTGAFPNASNTGWQHTGVTLTPMACPANGVIEIERPGTVIDGADISCEVLVKADDVTIRRSRVQLEDDRVGIHTTDEIHNLRIEDTEIIGAPGCDVAIGFQGWSGVRLNIHGCGDGVRAEGDNVLEDSWIHDYWDGVINGQVPDDPPHHDGVQTISGSNVTLRHNRIDNPHSQTSCILIGGERGSPSNWLVEDNLLNGGNWTIFLDPKGTNRVFRNNTFTRAHVFGPGDLHGEFEWVNNRYTDGELIVEEPRP
jgi:hypothetical protein